MKKKLWISLLAAASLSCLILWYPVAYLISFMRLSKGLFIDAYFFLLFLFCSVIAVILLLVLREKPIPSFSQETTRKKPFFLIETVSILVGAAFAITYGLLASFALRDNDWPLASALLFWRGHQTLEGIGLPFSIHEWPATLFIFLSLYFVLSFCLEARFVYRKSQKRTLLARAFISFGGLVGIVVTVPAFIVSFINYPIPFSNQEFVFKARAVLFSVFRYVPFLIYLSLKIRLFLGANQKSGLAGETASDAED